MSNGLMRHVLLLGTASCLALGEGMPAAAKPGFAAISAAPASQASADGAEIAKPSVEVPDLDFSDDFPVTAKPVRPARAGASLPAPVPAEKSGSRAWIYWTLGLSAAAGGAAWFAHDYLDQAATPRRSTEVFTDAAQ